MIDNTYYVVLIAIDLLPLMLMTKARKRYFVPFIIYGISVLVFLILGLPLSNERLGVGHPYSLEYFMLIFVALTPLYLGLMLYFVNGFVSRRERHCAALTDLDVLLGVLFAGIILYAAIVELPPLWSLIRDGKSLALMSGGDIYALRGASTNAATFGLAKLIFFAVPMLLFIFAWNLHAGGRPLSFRRLFFISLLCPLVSLSFLHKAALASYVPALFMVYLYYNKISLVKSVVLGAAGFVLLALLFGFYYSGESYSRLLNLILFRVFGSYSFNTQFALDLFPAEISFLQGWSMVSFLGLGGGGNLPAMVMGNVYGSAGNASLSVYGHWYANYGWLGVQCVALFVFVWLTGLAAAHKYMQGDHLLMALWLFCCARTLEFSRMDFLPAIGVENLVYIVVFITIYKASKLILGQLVKRLYRGGLIEQGINVTRV